MKAKLSIIIFLFVLKSFSQITFEKGYFIDNSGKRTECLIRNNDWKNNPVDFDYKILNSEEIKNARIETIIEFGVGDNFKFQRLSVAIDKSSKNLSHMSRSKEPIYKNETLFLRVLVEGKATLFKYVGNNLKRFFYKVNDSEVDQLVFKKYKAKDGNVAHNELYKQQLLNNLRCGVVSISEIYKVKYNEKQLREFFEDYNICSNSDYKNFKNKESKKDLFNLTLRPRYNSTSLYVDGSSEERRDLDFGTNSGFKFGVQFEYILPFNKNKWSITLEPTYQKFNSEIQINRTITVPVVTTIQRKIKVDYTSIELPLGMRHYMFLSKKSKIFLGASILFDIAFDSKIDFEVVEDLDIKSDNSLVFGLGYMYDKYSLEINYATTRDLISTYRISNSKFDSFSVIFGYTLF